MVNSIVSADETFEHATDHNCVKNSYILRGIKNLLHFIRENSRYLLRPLLTNNECLKTLLPVFNYFSLVKIFFFINLASYEIISLEIKVLCACTKNIWCLSRIIFAHTSPEIHLLKISRFLQNLLSEESHLINANEKRILLSITFYRISINNYCWWLIGILIFISLYQIRPQNKSVNSSLNKINTQLNIINRYWCYGSICQYYFCRYCIYII